MGHWPDSQGSCLLQPREGPEKENSNADLHGFLYLLLYNKITTKITTILSCSQMPWVWNSGTMERDHLSPSTVKVAQRTESNLRLGNGSIGKWPHSFLLWDCMPYHVAAALILELLHSLVAGPKDRNWKLPVPSAMYPGLAGITAIILYWSSSHRGQVQRFLDGKNVREH